MRGLKLGKSPIGGFRGLANITKPLSLAHLLFVHSPVNNFWAVTDYSSISQLQIETHGQKDLHPPHHLYRVLSGCFINAPVCWGPKSTHSDHFWWSRYCRVPDCVLYLDAQSQARKLIFSYGKGYRQPGKFLSQRQESLA